MEAREKTTTDCFAEKFSETKPKTDLLYLKTMPSVIITKGFSVGIWDENIVEELNK